MKIDWYSRNELPSLTAEPEQVSEIVPDVESIVSETPEYPATVPEADELEVSEIIEDTDKVIEEGE